MSKRWIVNASPLILLGKIGQAGLLRALSDELVIPREVVREVGVQAEGRQLIEQLLSASDVRRGDEIEIPEEIQVWDLGRGESEVLALGLLTGGGRVVVDDLEARRCAHAVGFGMIGTLGVILRARHLGLIPAARPLLDQLRQVGLYVSDELISRALARLNE